MPDSLWLYLWIGLGSALGGVGRYWMSGWIAQRFGDTFPWGTMAVNVSGCFIAGLVAALAAQGGRGVIPPRAGAFLLAGFCGGFTTFSAFSVQTLSLMRDGQWPQAGASAFGSLLLCLVSVWLGHQLGQLAHR